MNKSCKNKTTLKRFGTEIAGVQEVDSNVSELSLLAESLRSKVKPDIVVDNSCVSEELIKTEEDKNRSSAVSTPTKKETVSQEDYDSYINLILQTNDSVQTDSSKASE